MILYNRLYILLIAFLAILVNPTKADAQGVHHFGVKSVLAEGKWVKIALEGKEDGVYQITYSQLSSMGFNNPDNVGIYGFGGHVLDEAFSTGHIDDLPEIATYHDVQNKRILFFGQGLIKWEYNDVNGFIHRQNPYASKACYFVHQKDSAALQMESVSCGYLAKDTISCFDAHLLHETESINIGKTGREYYGESFSYTNSQLFNFDDALEPCTAKLTANFAALTASSSSFSVKAGDLNIGTVTLNGSNSDYVYATEGTLMEEYQIESSAKPAFRINFNSSAATKTAYLNYIKVEGKQKITIAKDKNFTLLRSIDANSKNLAYRIEEYFESLQVWDLSNPQEPKIQEIIDGCFSSNELGIKEYALVDLDSKKFNGVSIIGEVAHQNLHSSTPIDMIIVVPSGLKGYAEELADFRNSHDEMEVLVVTPEQIYNEYSSGTADATAIRLYMKQYYDRYRNTETPLKYLLLFGDGNYDNRKIDGSSSYLVSYETESSLVETSSTVCDDYFGFLDDSEGGKKDYNGRYSISSDKLDIGIGRLPVHQASDAESVVKKIIDYSSNYHYGNWKNTLCFLSDDDKISDSATDSPNAHMIHNDQVISVIQDEQGHKEFIYQKIYLPAYTQSTTASGTDYPDAKKEFLETLQHGALLVNFAGHGSSSSITHEMLMTTSRASELNMKNLPLWVTASCDISRWDADETSMGETLLLNNNGGAIALISTVRVVYAQQNLSLNLAIAKNLFNRHSDGSRYRLGDIIKEAKISLGSDYNKLNFCLLGDPSLVLAYPEYEMEIASVDYDDKVTIKGRVIDPGTKETASEFNGLVYPTIYSGEETITADKGLYQEPIYSFNTRTKKIFTGRDVVSNGEFEFSFVMPKDIPEGSTEGLINLYACSENIDEAQGYYSNFIVTTSSKASTDTIGPEINKIFINSGDFKNGDEVGPTPYFFAEVHDQSGFNATGNSIGHDVTLTVKCTSNTMLASKQYSLNNYLTTYTGDPTTGNVRYSIPSLADGEYDIIFKIWDSWNNSSSATLHIKVESRQKHNPVLIQAYPSPAVQGEQINFRVLHNMPESATEIRLQIYTQTGIKVLETVSSSNSSDIVYLNKGASSVTDINTALNADETSEFLGSSTMTWKASVAPGVYIYRVYLSSGGSESASESKLLMIKPE